MKCGGGRKLAVDFKKIEAEFEKLIKRDLKEFANSVVSKDFKALVDAYNTCLKLEGELIALLPAARANGVNGDDIKSFLRDPAFKKKYKEWDAAVDVIDAAEKKAYQQTTQTGFLSNAVAMLKKDLAKNYPNSKDPAVIKLAKAMDDKIKEMNAASDAYLPAGRDKKMHEYSSKFEKKIEKILDLAPPSENPEEPKLPEKLDASALEQAKKDLATYRKTIDAAVKKMDSIIVNTTPYTRSADNLCEKERFIIDQTSKKFEKLVLDYETLVKKVGAKAIKEASSGTRVDIEGFVTDIKKLSNDMKAVTGKALSALAKVRKTLG